MVGIGIGFLSFGNVGGVELGADAVMTGSRRTSASAASFSERGLTTAWPSGIFSSPGILPIGTVPSKGSPYHSAAPVVGEHLTLGQPGLMSRCVTSEAPLRLSKQTSGSAGSCCGCRLLGRVFCSDDGVKPATADGENRRVELLFFS